MTKLEFIRIASYTDTLMKQATERIGEPIYSLEECPFYTALPGSEPHIVHWVMSRLFCVTPDPESSSWTCGLCGETEGA